uniref:Uncharacterized protein n=1 Tax=Anguilla anguilla TaxID=7936 RepID=A0A0E9RND8_ANGAN
MSILRAINTDKNVILSKCSLDVSLNLHPKWDLKQQPSG